jgi:hypothetical protein
VGHQGKVVARSFTIDSAEYDISWDEAATRPQA